MFTRAIVRTPGKSMIHGLTSAGLGPPDPALALLQHDQYIKALRESGLETSVLKEDERHPDSTFVEDVALLTSDCAIVLRPGAPSRRGETAGIKKVLRAHFSDIEEVHAPGTVEGGDVLMVGSHFFIGLSRRTNEIGARQVIEYLEKYGRSGTLIRLERVLHLKTGLAYLEHNNLVACGEFLAREEFRSYNILRVEEDESYAANCIWVNDKVLMPKGYPRARQTIEHGGYSTIEIDVSEFRKLDGGLSCLSLRF